MPKKNTERIVEFIINNEGVAVKINPTEAINVIVGIAGTIQLICEESNKDRKDIMSDINKVLDILEEKEEEN